MLITYSGYTNAAIITLTDYLVSANPGDSWTYTSLGTVTTPPYASYQDLLPTTQETDIAFSIEPTINGYFQIQSSLTVAAGTFNNVLALFWLDENFSDNNLNSSYGVTGGAVTDIEWYAAGIGQLKYTDVGAATGTLLDGYELTSYSVSSVPIPAAVWLFGSGFISLMGFSRRKA